MPARSYTWSSGESVLLGAVALAGTSAGGSSDTGTLTTALAAVPLAGTSAGSSADTGNLSSLARVPLAGTSAGSSSDTGALTALIAVALAGTSAGSSSDTAALDAVPAKHIIVRILSSTGWLDLSPIVGYYSTNTHPAGTTISIPQNTHKLRPTRGLMVTIHNETTGAQEVADVTVTIGGDVTVAFVSSAAANSKRVTIMGPVL